MNLSKYTSTPKTTYFTVRMDVRLMATILKVYQQELSYTPNNKVELIKVALEHYADLLSENFQTEQIESTEEALEILSVFGLNPVPQGKITDTLSRQIRIEEIKSGDLSLQDDLGDAFKKIKGEKK